MAERLTDVGGKLLLWRESRGIWHAVIGGRCGWGLSVSAALKDAMRGGWS